MSLPRAAVIALAAVAGVGLTMCFSLRQPDALKFSHKLHTDDQGLECSECHGEMSAVTSLSGSHTPKEAQCLECHEERDDCSLCHQNATEPQAPPPRLRLADVTFSHEIHVAAQQGKCTPCHDDVARSERPVDHAEPQIHLRCMGCHRGDYRDIGCTKCHADFREDRRRPFSLFDHQGDFLKRHGALARGDRVACAHCHDQASCAECHSRMAPDRASELRSDEVDRSFAHPRGWMSRHAIEAQAEPGRCLTCHRQSRCATCHQERGVAAGRGVGLGPHPQAWLREGASDFHGTAARRDIASCYVCHDRGPDTNCIACHRVGGTGGSPHGPGWDTDLDRATGRACLYCHAGGR